MNYRRNEDRWPIEPDRVKYNNILSVEVTDEVTTEPVTLAEIKEHLLVDYTDKDAYLTKLGKRARVQIEKELNLALAPQTIKVKLRAEVGYISLPYWTPEAEIVEVTDHEGETVADYEIVQGILNTSFDDTVYIEYETGFETCPEDYKQMILERCAWLDKNRGDEKRTNNNKIWLV